MSKLRLGLLVTTAMAVIAAIAGGCSKPTPTAPGQGTPTDDRLMMFGFQDQEIPSVVFVTIPKDATKPPFVTGIGLVSFGDTSSSVLEFIDGTESNSFRPYSRQSGEEFRPATDFDISNVDKQISLGADVGGIVHPTGVKNRSEYMVTGLLNGVITQRSPYTNTVVPWGTTDYGLTLNIDAIQVDSVLTVRFEPDPRAVIYVLEISLFSVVDRSDYLLQGSLLLPIAYPHNISVWGTVPPGFESGIRIPLYTVPFSKIFPRSIVVRVSAIDASGRVVSRSPSDYVPFSQGSDANNIYVAAVASGGFIMTANPYPKGYGITSDVTAGDAASPASLIPHEEMNRLLAGRAGISARERVVTPWFQEQISPTLPPAPLPALSRKLPPGILPPAK
jgi:hypothetical protein